MPRTGILSLDGASSDRNPGPLRGFSIGLRESGYVEGQNILIEGRYADGRPDRLAVLAAELVQLKVDVILAAGPDPREAARQATRTDCHDLRRRPRQGGLGAQPARPGGNVTGLTVTFDEARRQATGAAEAGVPACRPRGRGSIRSGSATSSGSVTCWSGRSTST
jgi:putative ABC transport system substrate-binding protein